MLVVPHINVHKDLHIYFEGITHFNTELTPQ